MKFVTTTPRRPAMFQTALYDLIYKSMKDYPAEAGHLADLIRRTRPSGRTLLDVGCGTGEHARLLGEVHGFEVDGVDLDPAMLAIARTKWPRGRFDVADMTDFHLGRHYDAVLNLFGAIASAGTLPRLRDTLACMRDHVAPGGVVIVQPYLTPDEVQVGTGEYAVELGDRRVVRTRRSERVGPRQRVHFHFTVEGPDGTQELDETHEFGLFTIDETLAAFAAVGLTASHAPDLPDAPGGRGFYVATARAQV
jgi:SAM-dependent methyltransferase